MNRRSILFLLIGLIGLALFIIHRKNDMSIQNGRTIISCDVSVVDFTGNIVPMQDGAVCDRIRRRVIDAKNYYRPIQIKEENGQRVFLETTNSKVFHRYRTPRPLTDAIIVSSPIESFFKAKNAEIQLRTEANRRSVELPGTLALGIPAIHEVPVTLKWVGYCETMVFDQKWYILEDQAAHVFWLIPSVIDFGLKTEKSTFYPEQILASEKVALPAAAVTTASNIMDDSKAVGMQEKLAAAADMRIQPVFESIRAVQNPPEDSRDTTTKAPFNPYPASDVFIRPKEKLIESRIAELEEKQKLRGEQKTGVYVGHKKDELSRLRRELNILRTRRAPDLVEHIDSLKQEIISVSAQYESAVRDQNQPAAQNLKTVIESNSRLITFLESCLDADAQQIEQLLGNRISLLTKESQEWQKQPADYRESQANRVEALAIYSSRNELDHLEQILDDLYFNIRYQKK